MYLICNCIDKACLRSSEFIINHEGLDHFLKLRQARYFVINHIRFSFDKHFLASRSEINDPIEVYTTCLLLQKSNDCL